jgi:tetratricopeptide (TPR) repeat protein
MKDTSWGIPDDTFKFMSGIAQAFIDKKMYQEALTVMEDIVEIYRPAYEWNKELLPVWKEKANSKNASQKTKEIYSRMENFVKNYEEFSSKKDSFIQELIRVYENVVRLDDQNTRKIYEEDWSTNILTGENEQINLEEVIERLKKKISG